MPFRNVEPLLCSETICSCFIYLLTAFAAVHNWSFSENSGYCWLCNTQRFCGMWNRKTANCRCWSAGLPAVCTGALAKCCSLIFYGSDSSSVCWLLSYTSWISVSQAIHLYILIYWGVRWRLVITVSCAVLNLAEPLWHHWPCCYWW